MTLLALPYSQVALWQKHGGGIDIDGIFRGGHVWRVHIWVVRQLVVYGEFTFGWYDNW